MDRGKEESYAQRNLELRAADFYTGLRKPESEWKTIDDLAPQLAEFEHRVRAGDYDGAGRVLEPIDLDYMLLWGHYARMVELREKLLGRLTDPGLRVGNLHSLGDACYALGQVERAIKLYEDALAIVREIGDRRGEGVQLGHLGLAYHSLGQFERAIELCEKALAIAWEIGDRWNEGVQLGYLGWAYRVLGQFERAIKLYEEALAIAREIGHRSYESVWLGHLGLTYCALGQVERAIKLYEEALAITREIGDQRGESHLLLELGEALLATGELSEARQRCTEALALDVPETSYSAALALGIALLHQRDPAAGETFADAATRCRARLDQTENLYEARYALAAALVGGAVCDPRWVEEGERARLLAPALEEYRRALENCAAPGVVRDALRDLEMIRAAGVEGLEPAFELLESAV